MWNFYMELFLNVHYNTIDILFFVASYKINQFFGLKLTFQHLPYFVVYFKRYHQVLSCIKSFISIVYNNKKGLHLNISISIHIVQQVGIQIQHKTQVNVIKIYIVILANNDLLCAFEFYICILYKERGIMLHKEFTKKSSRYFGCIRFFISIQNFEQIVILRGVFRIL